MRMILAIAALAAPLAANAADLGGHVLPAAPALPAVLAPATSWTGCYGQAGAGWAVSKTEVSIPPWASLDGLGADGGVLSVGAGCDLQMGAVVVGGFADYAWHQDHAVNVTFGPTSIDLATLEEQWAVGGRAGVLVGPSLVYALAGYTQAKLDIGDHEGIVYGGGVELPIGAGFSLKTEYRFSDLETVRYGGLIDVDPDVHEVRAALSYKVGVGR
jgi:opacity protein-like surface antigen